MGKIQGAINGALGAAAASMVTIGHAKSTSEQKAQTAENNAVVAEGQATNAINASDEEVVNWENVRVDTGETDPAGKPIMQTKATQHAAARVALDQAQADYDAARGGKDAVKRIVAKHALNEAIKAFETLDVEYQAIRSRRDRAFQMMEHATDLREKADAARAKHERLWR